MPQSGANCVNYSPCTIITVCAEAESGRRGVELARTCRPDLIILDLSMPVLNGFDAAPELRKLFRIHRSYSNAVSRDALEASGINQGALNERAHGARNLRSRGTFPSLHRKHCVSLLCESNGMTRRKQCRQVRGRATSLLV